MAELATLTTCPGDKRRRLRFVEEYIKDFNAVAALCRAGYSKTSASAQSVPILADPWVKEQIDLRTRDRITLHDVTPERIIMELARIAFADPRKALTRVSVTALDGQQIEVDIPKEMTQLDDDTARAVKEIELDRFGKRSFRFADKTGALTTLAKMQGLIVERKQVEAKITAIAHDSDSDPDAYLAEIAAANEGDEDALDPDAIDVDD